MEVMTHKPTRMHDNIDTDRDDGTDKETVRSTEHVHESACPLLRDDHVIAREFLDVIETVAERSPVECDYGAAGCGTCFETDDPVGMYWMAQGLDDVETSLLTFTTDENEIADNELCRIILEVADELGVEARRLDDVSCVVLGDNGDDKGQGQTKLSSFAEGGQR